MLITMLKSKLHHARVTESELEYAGSLTIDQELMDAVRMRPYEKILVANMANGPAFPLKHMQKDMRLALLLGDSCNQALHTSSAANNAYIKAKKDGCSDDDFSAVIKNIEK